jgi:hypothetical protein
MKDARPYTAAEKRRLRRYVCCLCGRRLDQEGCGAIWGEKCSQRTMAKRRAACLDAYRPRRKHGVKA